jgi:hypothetical protein
MSSTVTLEVTRTATVVVDMERGRVQSVDYEPWDVDDARAVHIPGSLGERQAKSILKSDPKQWLR